MNNDKIPPLSLDIEATEREKLRSLFPQCFTENSLNIDKLLALCGEFIDPDENDREKYEFRWQGKQDCLKLAGKRSAGTLRPCMEDSVDFDTTQNIYIEGDNLEVLKILQTAYYRKVKMIYIDPPYNTGNDFVYTDDFADPLARYREITQQTTKSNPESMGRFHTNWLNMMYPRLRLAANLLRDDGVIFISIDDNEIDNLKKLCNEVFGEENFICQFIWQRAFSPKNDARFVSNSHDYVLMYAKRAEEFRIGRLPRTEEANARYQNPDNDPRGEWSSSDISVKTYNAECDYPITAPSGRVIEPPTGRCWSLSKNAFFERLNDNRIWFGDDGNNTPRIKRFLSELKHDGMVPTSILMHKDVGHSQEGAQEVSKLLGGGYFNGPKPVRLLRHLLTLANTDKDSIILDFFSGSATTAHAVMQLNAEDGGNRRFICVQLPEVTDEKSEAFKAGYTNICKIGKERIRRAGVKIRDEAGLTAQNLDTGFKVYKLDSSNLKLWDDTPITGENALEILEERIYATLDIIKGDRSNEDVVYEVMLKLGQELTEPIVPIDLGDGKVVYGVGEDVKFIVCLAKGITVEDSKAMAEYEPGRIVFADACFQNSEEKSNVKLTLTDRGIAIKAL
ncbi:MAG: site-specific DNA-methyltransferase [Oscillospiraceae bacterium]|nr:site-specific DNA-methyltransferase [Oscillospiraceae bacterium]